jgi:hypothetical protein
MFLARKLCTLCTNVPFYIFCMLYLIEIRDIILAKKKTEPLLTLPFPLQNDLRFGLWGYIQLFLGFGTGVQRLLGHCNILKADAVCCARSIKPVEDLQLFHITRKGHTGRSELHSLPVSIGLKALVEAVDRHIGST